MAEINKYFKEKILKMGEENIENLIPIAKRAAHLTEIGISSDEELVKYIFLEKEANKMGVTIPKLTASKIVKNSNDSGDILYGILKYHLNSAGIKKVAYPNPGLSVDSLTKEVDLNNWLELVHKIYKDCKSGKRTKEAALNFYSNILDNEEKPKFLRWFNYFASGEHKKYSNNKEEKMKKESLFQSGLVGSGFYSQDTRNNMPGDSFEAGSLPEPKTVSKNTEKERLINWKKSINRACKRIDTLLRDGDIPYDEYSEMAKHLFELSSLIKRIKLASTMSDVTHRTANIFKKAGHSGHADMLAKIAQEISDEPPVQPPAQEVPSEEVPGLAQEEQEAGPSQQEQKSGVEVPEPDNVEPAKLRDIEPIPGPKAGEYDILAGDISLEDAAKKLDEVAGMLADRRIIRQLAEFDIMLDKIGIASMFPELAESQSKLIDAFSYALTRVTKMMGQLSNAKSLIEAGGPLPGASQNLGEQTEVAEEAPDEAPLTE